MSQKIALITGAGMDAKCMVHFLLSKKYTVIVATRRTTLYNDSDFYSIFSEDLQNNPGAVLQMENVDVSDFSSVKELLFRILHTRGRIDELYHLAAASHVGDSYNNPLLNIQTNGLSVFYFLESLRNLQSTGTKFYFAATSEMYSGNINDKKYNESSAFYPKTSYAISKVEGFNWTRYFRETYGMFACSGILFNHSCEYRHPSFFIRKVTQTFAKIITGKARELKIGHLNWARDEFWADFGVEAMWKMLQLNAPMDFVICNGNTKWGEEYLDAAAAYFNLDWKKVVSLDSSLLRKNEVVKLEGDPWAASAHLGWKVNRIPFQDHINFMCQYDYLVESTGNTKLLRPRIDYFRNFPNANGKAEPISL